MRYEMKLEPKHFAKVKSGEKNVELRLNDEKRKAITSGDVIIFTNTENAKERVAVRVDGYYVYSSFAELFSKVDNNKLLGCTLAEVEKIYTKQDQQKYGVKGIRFTLIPYKTLDEMSQQEIEQQVKSLYKHCSKTVTQIFKNLDKGDELLEFLTHLVKHQTEIFYDNIDEINYDIFKWSICEHIAKAKTLLDTLQEKEDEIGFPIIHKYQLPNTYEDDPNIKK